MLEAFVTAAILGLAAGLVPGLYTTVVASAAFEHGFRAGARLALVPLVTDLPPMLLTTVLLHQVDDEVLTAIGVLGGAGIVFLGVRLVQRQGRRWRERAEIEERLIEREKRRTFWAMALGGLMSPAPWVFWIGAAGPLLLRAWYRSRLDGVVFAATLFAMLTGTALVVAWAASRGRRRIDVAKRRNALRVVGASLGVIGMVMIWQSFNGNFQRLVREQEAMRTRIE